MFFPSALRAPAVALLGLVSLAATPPVSDAPKTHVMHLGADVSVVWKGKPRPVIDAHGNSFVIDVNGSRTTVPESSRDTQVRLESALKVDTWSATVSAVKSDLARSMDNNPHLASEAAAAQAQDAAAMSDIAAANFRQMERMATIGRADATANPALTAQLENARQMLDDSLSAQATHRNAPDSARGMPSGINDHDALALSFDLAAPRALAKPYLVLAVRYQTPGNKGQVAVFTQALPRIDESPRRVRFFRGGFPRGFELERCEIHLYEAGREIPTNVSSRRLELTADEAFQYALVEHLAAPDERTQAPAPAREFWPADLSTQLSAENHNRFIHVRVNKDGLPAGAFHDEAGKLPVTDADVLAVLPTLRFLPALAKGKPVPGMCRINLGANPL